MVKQSTVHKSAGQYSIMVHSRCGDVGKYRTPVNGKVDHCSQQQRTVQCNVVNLRQLNVVKQSTVHGSRQQYGTTWNTASVEEMKVNIWQLSVVKQSTVHKNREQYSAILLSVLIRHIEHHSLVKQGSGGVEYTAVQYSGTMQWYQVMCSDVPTTNTQTEIDHPYSIYMGEYKQETICTIKPKLGVFQIKQVNQPGKSLVHVCFFLLDVLTFNLNPIRGPYSNQKVVRSRVTTNAFPVPLQFNH